MSLIVNSEVFFFFVQLELITYCLLENEENELFIMFLFVVLKHRLLIKSYKEDYLKMLFENFIEKFNMSNNN